MHSFAAVPVAEESFAWSSECWLDINGKEEFWDDVNGGWLDPAKVTAASAEELEWMVKRGVFIKVPELECRTKQGRPLTLKWVDTIKSDGRYRSRLVVREIKKAKSPDEKLDPQTVFSSMHQWGVSTCW